MAAKVERYLCSDNTYMQIESYRPAEARFSVRLVWLHGWAQSRQVFYPVSSFFKQHCENHLIDFPGFGGTPTPERTWGTIDYAQHLADWLQKQPSMPTIILGHSFGGRVAIQMASRHVKLVDGIVLIATPGLRQAPCGWLRVKIKYYKYLARIIMLVDKIFKKNFLEKVKQYMGSDDYRSAGPMRDILVKTINEDIRDIIKKICQPTLLLYGDSDTETPVSVGQGLHQNIVPSDLVIFPHQDHWSILKEGHQQVISYVKKFLEEYYVAK